MKSKRKNSDASYLWVALPSSLGVFMAVLGVLKLIDGDQPRTIEWAITGLGLVAVLISFWRVSRIQKANAAKKEAFEQEWRRIRGLSGNLQWRMDDEEWYKSLSVLRELVSPYISESDSEFEDLVIWLNTKDPWSAGMSKAIASRISNLKDREWEKQRKG